MIDRNLFLRIKFLHEKIRENPYFNPHNVFYALAEEVGEFGRAVRVEDQFQSCKHKTLTESSRIEAVDILLTAVEAYIARGGTYEDLMPIAEKKLDKWESNL